MNSTNFVFLLAVVTLVSFLAFWIWQFVKIRKQKRRGAAEELKEELKERY